jgi:hypothetical protein
MPITNGKSLFIINGIETHMLINQCYSTANNSQSCNIKLIFKCNQNVVIKMQSTQSYKCSHTYEIKHSHQNAVSKFDEVFIVYDKHVVHMIYWMKTQSKYMLPSIDTLSSI